MRHHEQVLLPVVLSLSYKRMFLLRASEILFSLVPDKSRAVDDIVREVEELRTITDKGKQRQLVKASQTTFKS